jgi:hypothetical protein
MTMNRNDFVALAEFAKANLHDGYDANYLARCQALADTLKSRAPDFNAERFLNACETPVCPHHGRRTCLENHMGVLWCVIANRSAESED